MDIHVKEVAYHRNGVGGEGFHVVRFAWDEAESSSLRNMVGIVFEGSGRVAVLDADLTAMGNIAFAMGNSWRGDHFEAVLREAIESYETALREDVDTRATLLDARATIDRVIEDHDKGLDKVAVV